MNNCCWCLYKDILLTDIRRVVGCTKDQLRRPVIPRADITNIGLPSHQNFCWAKIAKLQDPCCWIQQQILGLDVTMANANWVDVREGPQELIHIKFDLQHWHRLLEFGIMAACTIDGLRYIFEHEVKINFIFLLCRGDEKCMPLLTIEI